MTLNATQREKEPKTEFAETGLVGLDIIVPGLTPENAEPIMRDIKRTLENCGRLSLLDEFTVTLRVEYIEVPMAEAKAEIRGGSR